MKSWPPIPILKAADWQMRHGERAALEGVLAQLRPHCAIELGTHLGGSLERIAAHSTHVHSFDLELQVESARFPNVTFHTGDSHILLPQVLEELKRSGQTVDFALVDGDHSPAGVRRDVMDLLSSDAMGNGVILMHDTSNEAVRDGILSIPFASFPKVEEVNLDFVMGRLAESRLSDGWAGFGLITLKNDRTEPGEAPSRAPLPSYGSTPGATSRALRTFSRRTRRAAGLTLRRFGLHPAQRSAVRRNRPGESGTVR